MSDLGSLRCAVCNEEVTRDFSDTRKLHGVIKDHRLLCPLCIQEEVNEELGDDNERKPIRGKQKWVE